MDFLQCVELGRHSGQMESNSGATAEGWQRKDGEKGNFSRIEGGFTLH